MAARSRNIGMGTARSQSVFRAGLYATLGSKTRRAHIGNDDAEPSLHAPYRYH